MSTEEMVAGGDPMGKSSRLPSVNQSRPRRKGTPDRVVHATRAILTDLPASDRDREQSTFRHADRSPRPLRTMTRFRERMESWELTLTLQYNCLPIT